jgi:hypothetical protein
VIPESARPAGQGVDTSLVGKPLTGFDWAALRVDICWSRLDG